MAESSLELIPPNLRYRFTDFREVGRTPTYRIFNAKLLGCEEIHTIRVLDVAFGCKISYEQAAQLFLQELLHLGSLDPHIVLIETLEISGKSMAVATKNCTPLSYKLKNASFSNEGDVQSVVDVEKLIRSLTLEVKFLRDRMGISDCSEFLKMENIFIEKEEGRFIIGNWAEQLIIENLSKMT